jgi:hypothetical protein
MSVNERHFCMCITPDNLSEADKKRLAGHKAALLNAAQWDAGSVITVRFLEGDAGLQSRVRQAAEHWTKPGMAIFAIRAQPISASRSSKATGLGHIWAPCVGKFLNRNLR